MNKMPPNPQPGVFHPDQRKLEASLPYAPPVMEIKLFGKYRRVRDLLVPTFVVIVIGGIVTILVASWLYQQSGVQSFMAVYPGVPPNSAVQPGYSLLVRITHLLVFFYLLFLVRSGINILLDHPRLYGTINCTPGKEWIRWAGSRTDCRSHNPRQEGDSFSL